MHKSYLFSLPILILFFSCTQQNILSPSLNKEKIRSSKIYSINDKYAPLILVYRPINFFLEKKETQLFFSKNFIIGTGFFISKKGYALTAGHVAIDPNSEAKNLPLLISHKKRLYLAKVIWGGIKEIEIDVALIKIIYSFPWELKENLLQDLIKSNLTLHQIQQISHYFEKKNLVNNISAIKFPIFSLSNKHLNNFKKSLNGQYEIVTMPLQGQEPLRYPLESSFEEVLLKGNRVILSLTQVNKNVDWGYISGSPVLNEYQKVIGIEIASDRAKFKSPDLSGMVLLEDVGIQVKSIPLDKKVAGLMFVPINEVLENTCLYSYLKE